jgi:HEAT repeat protein
MAMATGIARKFKDMLLALALSGEAALAQAALPILLSERADAPELLLMALHSRSSQVQSLAAAKIVSGGPDSQLMGHLLEVLPNLEEPVHSMISEYLGAGGFDRYWRNYNRLDGEVRQQAGAALQKLDGRLADHLAARLFSPEVSEQLQAVQMVRQLGMVDRFGNTLCQLARHAGRTIRSAAAMALADVKTFDARSTLARCLHDDDERVQANAVEALAAGGGAASIVADKMDSAHNRTRANAIKWLLEAGHPAGPKALTAMLTDTRAAHRLSALWVVKMLRYAGASTVLDQLAIRDTDAKVRARAASVRRLLDMPQTQEAGA